MATIIMNYKCPSCHRDALTQIDRMVRCTCGWWMFLEEDTDQVSLKSVEYATVVAS
ncbi:MAG: hypothetical protein ACFFDW_10330 [Candidatus Thorarchaeota archaeon]